MLVVERGVDGVLRSQLRTSDTRVGENGAFASTATTVPVRASIDVPRNQVRATVRPTDLRPVAEISKGEVLDEVSALTWRAIGTEATMASGATADEAYTRRRYVAGSPACVTPGS